MSSLRLFTFDVTGTLLKFRVPPPIQYVQVGERFGVKTEPKIMTSSFKTHWRRMNAKHPNFGKSSGIGWERWWQELVCHTFVDSINPIKIEACTLNAIADYLLKNYKTAAYYKLYPGAEDILISLQTRNVPVGIISNFDERLPIILDELGLLKYFKFVLTSYEAGFEKPNPGIFNLALRKLGDNKVAPKYAMHIGDKPDLDYVAATRLGWNAALVHQEEPGDVLEQYPEVQPHLIFKNLADLECHISSMCQSHYCFHL